MGWGSRLSAAPSVALALACLAFIAGIGAGPMLAGADPLALGALLLASAIGLAAASSREARWGFLLLALLVIGATRYAQATMPVAGSVAALVGEEAHVEGIVLGEVERRVSGQNATVGQIEGHAGKVLVRLPLHLEAGHGDRLSFDCALQAPEPFNGFRYDRLLATRGIEAVCWRPSGIAVGPSGSFSAKRAVLDLKAWLVGELALRLPEPHAAFVSGLVFGGSSALGGELRDAFAATGTSHILAASGTNVSLVTYVLLSALMRSPLGRRRAIGIAAVLLVAYVIAAGATPAVMRAAIMASVLLLGALLRRKASMRNALLLTAAIMLAENPLILLDDPGFQLSLLATYAILEVAPRWSPRFAFVPGRWGLREALVGSLAAGAMTLPVILWHFGAVSLVSPIANVLIAPALPYLMALSLLAILAGAFHPDLGMAAALPAWALSSIVLHVIHWLGSLPWASVEPASARGLAIASIGLVLLIVFHPYARRKARQA